MEKQPVIQLEHVSKEFPGVKALEDINLEFYSGEVHALLGENGAGKSTLIKIISGVYERNAGNMRFEGLECHFENAGQAIAKGIRVIHQELSVIPGLTVAENVYLGREPKNKRGFLDKKEMTEGTQKILELLELKISPSDMVKKLSAAEKQMVEIARAISADAKVLSLKQISSG